MGIQVEFNPDLALRNMNAYKDGERQIEECIPEKIEVGQEYDFLKKGQRNYWLMGEIPLLETKGNGNLSKPKASIMILEAIHFLQNNEVYTRGKYRVIEVFNDDDMIHFNGFAKV